MTTATKRKKLHDFVNAADDKQVEVIYAFVEQGVEEKYDHWADKDFVNEMKSRLEEIESGKTKGLSWEEVKSKARGKLVSSAKKMELMKQASSDSLFLADIEAINSDFDFTDSEGI